MEVQTGAENLLALGIDERVFDRESVLRKNVLEYAKGFKTVHIVCRSTQDRGVVKEGNVVFYPVRARRLFLFPLFGFFRGLGIIRRTRGTWMVSSDTPFEVGIISFFLSRFAHGTFFLQIHTDVLSPFFRRASLLEYMRFWCARFLIPRADCIRVVSERIRVSLIRSRIAPSERISVLPIAIQKERFQEASSIPSVSGFLERFSLRVIAVGRLLDKEKNFSMLLRACKELRTSAPGIFLAIIGYGRDKARFLSLVRRYELENHVMIGTEREILAAMGVGAISLPDNADLIARLYKSFDVCVVPSQYEGWGRVPIEALAAGLPVIMTDVGLAGEVVRNGENGIVFPVGDTSALVRALLRFYQNPQERERLTKGARESSKRIPSASQAEYIERYLNILTSCRVT